MSTNLVPPRVPIVDLKTGLVTREWYRLFESLFRLGNGIGDEIAFQVAPVSSTDGVEAALRAANDAAATQPAAGTPSVFYAADDVLPLIGALRDEIAALRRLIDDLQKGPL